MFELVIKNGKCVLPHPVTGKLHTTQADIGVQNGKIIKIGSLDSKAAAHVIDAQHLHVLPGVIDTQVHFREPGLTHKEDLVTGSRSAALGGVTSYFEMPNTMPATTTIEAMRKKRQAADGRSWVNYAFFSGASPENIDQLAQLENESYSPGVKVFVGSSTGSLLVEDDFHIERTLRATGRRVTFHSEDEARLRERKDIAIQGRHAKFHHIWRDVESALKATERILKIARKLQRQVHILHVTTAEEALLLQQNQDIATMEVLPQHLTLSAPECYERLSTLAQQNPPIREKRHQDALWKMINNGTVKIIGSDHAPHTREEKSREYPNTPSGMPGVQTLLPIMLNHVNSGKLTLEKLVELVGENPRWVFGLKNKGRIALNEDADFTLVDLNRTDIIENKNMASRCGWTPFDGMHVKGWPVMSLIQGRIIMREGSLLGSASGHALEFSGGR